MILGTIQICQVWENMREYCSDLLNLYPRFEVVLRLRGGNSATVTDIVDLREYAGMPSRAIWWSLEICYCRALWIEIYVKVSSQTICLICGKTSWSSCQGAKQKSFQNCSLDSKTRRSYFPSLAVNFLKSYIKSSSLAQGATAFWPDGSARAACISGRHIYQRCPRLSHTAHAVPLSHTAHAVPCCPTLSNAVPCCPMLSHAVPCCPMLSHAVLCSQQPLLAESWPEQELRRRMGS